MKNMESCHSYVFKIDEIFQGELSLELPNSMLLVTFGLWHSSDHQGTGTQQGLVDDHGWNVQCSSLYISAGEIIYH
jgi:hypothetical protein